MAYNPESIFARRIFKGFLAFATILFLSGCADPDKYLRDADRTAYRIIAEQQMTALGKQERFTIDPPSETFRQRLLDGQKLPYGAPSSLSSRFLQPIEGWPLSEAEKPAGPAPVSPPWSANPVKISLIKALEIGARNSREYQDRKEDIFRAALDLDLERQEFRNNLTGLLEGLVSSDLSEDPAVSGVKNSASLDWEKRLATGLDLTSRIGIDLVRLLTMGGSSSLGIFADASISIPLLRGAGRDIVTEPITQAEREVVYSIYRFERFKRTFAVQVASEYLNVLQQQDEVKNTKENYHNLLASVNRARRLAEAGRLPEIQVDQAVQDAFRARDRWLSTTQSWSSLLDNFKLTIGLPPDALIELDRGELDKVVEAGNRSLVKENAKGSPPVSVDDDVAVYPSLETVLPAPGLDMDETAIIRLALANRLDLRIDQGRVYDKQRKVRVAADNLRPGLTLTGSTSMGEHRDVGGAARSNASLRPERGFFSSLLSLDWPFNRTAERNDLRNSLIDIEQAVRTMQESEDRIKLDVRDDLRNLAEYRERIRIQQLALQLARRRVDSTDLFLKAGRVQMRDLLEAQEALVQAQNSLVAAQVGARVAELALQRDTGLLEINDRGLYIEYRMPPKRPDKKARPVDNDSESD